CVIQGPGSHQIINQVIPSHIRIRTTQKLRHLSAAHPCTLLTISLKKLDTKLGNIASTEINHRTQMRLSRPQILNRHILRITRGTHVMLRIINLTTHKGGLQGRWLGKPLQRSNQSAKSFRKPRHASLPPPSAISCRARKRGLIILTHRLVPISVPLAVSSHSDFATVLQHLQTPQGHRHSTQRSNINRRFSAVPHPHLTQILLHSIIKRQTQRFLLTEPNRPVHHTVRKLCTRRSKIIPLTWGDLSALLLDVFNQGRRWSATTLNNNSIRRKIQLLSYKLRHPLSTSTLRNHLNVR